MKKKVLVLGAGLVAKPLVRYLLDHDFSLIIATRTVSKAHTLIDGHPEGRAETLDLTDPEGMDALIAESDLVISLVPYTFHVQVARACLVHGKHMVTTSYVSNEMRELGPEAEAKGLIFLNEIGVDPGIDHMSAMRIIHQVEAKGWKIVSFRSCCGGLPAPEANDNPWGYKFSWSPQGVLLAGRNSARWLEQGKVVDVESNDLFTNVWPVEVDKVGPLEIYPNRNSLDYVGVYGLEGISTLFRGTFRYRGWCEMVKGLVDLGWLNLAQRPADAKTLGQVTSWLLKADNLDQTEDERIQAAASRIGLDADGESISRMKWVGLFGDEPVSENAKSIIDVLGETLQDKLAYQPGERDMIVLRHDFVANTADGKEQRITSTLVDFGIPNGDSSMARTVSLPAAIATRLILEGKMDTVGVKVPVEPAIYNPVLDELEELDIVCEENWDA